MSILWAGGEDIDFPRGSGLAVYTNGSYFRSGYARCSIGVQNDSFPQIASVIISTPFVGGAVTSAWAHCYWAQTNTDGATSMPRFGFVKASTNNGAGLYWGHGTAGPTSLALLSYSGSGSALTQLAQVTGVFAAGGVGTTVDMQVINFGTTGTVNIYVNSNLTLTFSGNLTTGNSLTNFDGVASGSCNGYRGGISELIVADEDTRSMALVTMSPTSAGTTDAWSGGTFASVNPVSFSDASPVYTGTTALNEQFNLTDLPTGYFSVKAVRLAARAASVPGATASQIKLGFNSAGTVAVGSAVTPSAFYGIVEQIFAQNPVTSAPFALTDMNALQANLQSL